MMTESEDNPADRSGDAAVAVTLQSVERLGGGYRPYERHHFSVEGADGAALSFDRDVLRAGDVIGVLPIDRARGEVVLIRQFRLAAHLATGRGELVEIVAGRVDPGEAARSAASRECREEIGLDPSRMVKIMSFLPAAAFADELMSLWVAEVDASHVPDVAGEEDEGEIIHPLRLSIASALDMLARGVLRSAPLIIALQWLHLNEARLGDVFDTAVP